MKNPVTRLWNHFPRAVWLMFAIDAVIGMTFSIALPYLALYLHDVRSISMSNVGTLFLIAGLCTAGTNLLGGMLSDKFGRRRLFLIVTAISVVVYAVLAFLIGRDASLWLIFVVYILTRSIFGTIGPTELAIIADVAPRERLSEIYAFVRIGGNIGFAMGPAIGGYLLTYISYGWLFSVSSILCIILAALILFFLKETFVKGKEIVDVRSTLAVAKDTSYLAFVFFSMLLVLSVTHMGSTLSVFTVNTLHFTTAQYGLLLTTNGLAVAVMQYPVARLIGKTSRVNGLILGSLFYFAAYLSFGWIVGFGWALVALLIMTTGEVIFSPISSAVIAEMAPPEKRGRYMGFSALGNSVAYSIAPLFGGILLDRFSGQPVILWGIISSVSLVAAGGFWWWGKYMKKDPRSLKVT
jgi:MFS family permease